MPNQYTRLTKGNLERKLSRKRNPIRSMTQLAREFGVNTSYSRSDGTRGNATPNSFRNKVRSLVGEAGYKQIRNDSSVNLSYR